MEVLLPIIIVGGIGLVFGIILSVASIYMSVKQDDRISAIAEALPGANCGGCGFAGCQNYAEAIVNDGEAINRCAPGGAEVQGRIADILGVHASAMEKQVMVVACRGTSDVTKQKYIYDGIKTCEAAYALYSGDGACKYGCLGLGDCMRACKFDNIRIIDGIARIDLNGCNNCGVCQTVCPKGLIKNVAVKKRAVVLCSNHDSGKDVRKACAGGCIACGKCAKACPEGAIEIKDKLAVIDGAKCTGCGKCAEGCPVKCIAMMCADA